MMTIAKEIAKYIMETGVKETSEGNWRFLFNELDKQFGTNLSLNVGLIEAVEDVLYKVYGDAILDLCVVAPSGTPLTDDMKTRNWCCAGECPGYPLPTDMQFDINYALAYCPNYEWHEGDERTFGSYEQFEKRQIEPLPAIEDHLVYIITGEYNGIQDECMAFRRKESAIRKFEELTGFTWKQYLDGAYEYEFGTYFYRFFECFYEDQAEQ